MTALTCYSGMRAGEREVAAVVIEIGVFPVGWIMTGHAIRAILAAVCVIALVAGNTVHRRAFVLPVDMTGLTGHIDVFAFELERRQVVIERCRGPTIRGVTLAAIQPKATLVRLIVMMTGIAILQRHREVTRAARVDMTLHAGKTRVFAHQFE